MRYTKELQATIQKEIKAGKNPQALSEKYKIPLSIIISWADIEMTDTRAKEIAVRKYIAEITEAETEISDKIAPFIREDISDDDFVNLCDSVSKSLTSFSAGIIKSERNLNLRNDDISEAEQVLMIADKWMSNQLIMNRFNNCQ